MQHEQLSLLLGIVHQCPFEAVGLVNRSVAIGSLYANNTSTWHLEIQLHQALLTELRRSDDKIDFEDTEGSPRDVFRLLFFDSGTDRSGESHLSV